ncbi:hypothetical protein H2201_003004 [Coniosporium apollinis]|uniref:Mitochondrial K+-H+ exchange-related-domain-containing protein n=1 Tax=Coniosporium apollinis TaxID=61459 RepID=A0ABQ9NWV6_9PEZI|nr:hypothetical protein H2201_003004 [Coniosporium apollinis]
MRLFLLPISTRRSLIYCERIAQTVNVSERTYLDRLTTKASETWVSWEKSDSKVKKSVTEWGNKVFRRIPFEEWGLKTIPSLSETRKAAELAGQIRVEVLFPGRFLKEPKVMGILEKLATERQALHRKRMWWSIVGLPISAPFGLVPVVPNIPFFYLAFRAYSHWKALSGSQHLQFLVENKLLKPTPSAALDEMYTAGLIHPTREKSRAAPYPTREEGEQIAAMIEQQTNDGTEDVMLLKRWNGKLLAERFKLPDMEVEIERAVEQVEASIKSREELLKGKRELEQATAKPEEKSKE